jgi:hypothetical protein
VSNLKVAVRIEPLPLGDTRVHGKATHLYRRIAFVLIFRKTVRPECATIMASSRMVAHAWLIHSNVVCGRLVVHQMTQGGPHPSWRGGRNCAAFKWIEGIGQYVLLTLQVGLECDDQQVNT